MTLLTVAADAAGAPPRSASRPSELATTRPRLLGRCHRGGGRLTFELRLSCRRWSISPPGSFRSQAVASRRQAARGCRESCVWSRTGSRDRDRSPAREAARLRPGSMEADRVLLPKLPLHLGNPFRPPSRLTTPQLASADRTPKCIAFWAGLRKKPRCWPERLAKRPAPRREESREGLSPTLPRPACAPSAGRGVCSEIGLAHDMCL
jgi:hypothetical protein